MKFGPVPLSEAAGATLAHTVHLPGGAMKKGLLLKAEHIDRLRQAGIASVTVARLEPDDVGEDEAARRIATAIAGVNVTCAEAFTGRVNLFAKAAGLLRFDRDTLIALNSLDEGLTVATLPSDARVAAGRMIATVKIIPYALPGDLLEQANEILAGRPPLVSIAAFKAHRAGLILSETPGTKASVLKKRQDVTERRLAEMGSALQQTETVSHDPAQVADALKRMAAANLDPILLFGGSAIVDRGDVIPAAIELAGGSVRHLGMPVDPGNLLLLGDLTGRMVIGVPSCASSPKLNGLDWVLERCLAGLPTTSADIAAMAPGGLLMEITTRPQPRAGSAKSTDKPRIAALVLAAGRSTRMGPNNKLLEPVGGKAMVRHVAEAALASKADHVTVVTGARSDEVRDTLSGLQLGFVHNPDFAAGLSTSLQAGIEALGQNYDGVVVLLGDMPLVRPELLDALIDSFAPDDDRAICIPVHNGKRGNPVLWSARFFADMATIRGDTGARHLLGEHADVIAEVDWHDDSIFRDIDTPDALGALRQEL